MDGNKDETDEIIENKFRDIISIIDSFRAKENNFRNFSIAYNKTQDKLHEIKYLFKQRRIFR